MRDDELDPLSCMLLFHRSIRAALDAFDQLVSLARCGVTDQVKAAALCDFFKGPMRWHDVDERRSLLPRLAHLEPGAFAGALEAALDEHECVEGFVAAVLPHLQAVADGRAEPDADALRDAAYRLREVLEAHLLREERDVFPRARALLGGHDLDEMIAEIRTRRLLRALSADDGSVDEHHERHECQRHDCQCHERHERNE